MGACTSSAGKAAGCTSAAVGRAVATTTNWSTRGAGGLSPSTPSRARSYTIAASPTASPSKALLGLPMPRADPADVQTVDAFDTSAVAEMRHAKTCGAAPHQTAKPPLPMLPLRPRTAVQTLPSGNDLVKDGNCTNEASDEECPPLPRSKSAPMLPARAVPSRMELFRQWQEESRDDSVGQAEQTEPQEQPFLPAARSPTTANGESRRRKRRSVTFGEAEMVRFEPSEQE